MNGGNIQKHEWKADIWDHKVKQKISENNIDYLKSIM